MDSKASCDLSQVDDQDAVVSGLTKARLSQFWASPGVKVNGSEWRESYRGLQPEFFLTATVAAGEAVLSTWVFA